MKRTMTTALMMATAMALMLPHRAAAELIGACLSSAGSLSKVTVGSVPDCPGDLTPISWNMEGPEGPEGPIGPEGPQGPPAEQQVEVILGPTSTPRLGAFVGAFASADCLADFGPGARWATTKDLKTLAWDPDAESFSGWVDVYPIQRDSDGTITDISGHSGTIERLACGTSNSADGRSVTWLVDTSEGLGLFSMRQAGRPWFAGCGNSNIRTLCVGPKP